MLQVASEQVVTLVAGRCQRTGSRTQASRNTSKGGIGAVGETFSMQTVPWEGSPHHVRAFATSSRNGSRGRGLGLHNRLAGQVDEGIEMDTRKFGQIQQQGVQG